MSELLVLERPYVLLALILLPAFAWFRLRLRRRRYLPFAPLQYRSAPAWRRRLALFELPLELLLLGVAILGLAGPYRETRLELIEDEGIDVALVLDISLSMLAEDFPPNRLEALREIARDFIHRAGSHRIGIVVFAKDTFVHTPLTTDHGTLLELLESASVYAVDQGLSGGTAIGDALLVAAETLTGSRIEGRDQALILITDGESNSGLNPALAARQLADQDIRFYAIGIGGEEPVEVFFEGERVGRDQPYLAVLDDAELKTIAELAGGRYFRATDLGALERIFGGLSRLESAPLEVREIARRRSYVGDLSLALVLLTAVYLGLGGLILRRPFR